MPIDKPTTEIKQISDNGLKFLMKEAPVETGADYPNTRDDINQNQFDSLVSFTYNVGVTAFKNSTLLKRINTNASQQSIINAFMMWNKPKEIIGRRKREVELYFS